MAVWFEGTSTKNTYKAGDRYETPRGVVQANKDGSFTNVSTGQVSRGSSQSATANFYASGSDIALLTGGGKSDSVAQKAFEKDRQNAAGERVSSPGAVTGGASAQGGGERVRVISPTLATLWADKSNFIRTNGWSGKDDPAQDLLWGGFHWQSNPKWTNMELAEARYGDSEVFQTLGFLSTFGADLGWNARRAVWGDNHQNINVGDELTKAVVNQFTPEAQERHLDMLGGWVSDIRGWAAENKAREDREKRLQEEFDSAWDARLAYGKSEWDKIHTPMNGPLYEERLTPNVWGY